MATNHLISVRPGGTDLDELVGTDQVALQGKHAEQQVAIGVHGKSPPRSPGVGKPSKARLYGFSQLPSAS
jgi:hypothetical protein